MFNFGDEIIMGNNKIAWLMWIQIFVMFLLTLTILLSYFGFSYCFDDNGVNDVDPTTINECSLSLTCSSTSSPLSTCFQTPKVTINHDVEEAEVPTRKTESISERDGSSDKDLSPSNSELVFHPCSYFEAFLKCFGLGKSFKRSLTREKKHED